MRDAMADVIDHHRELVGPVPVSVSREQVTTLCLRILVLVTKYQVVEGEAAVGQNHPSADTWSGRQSFVAAGPGVTQLPAFDQSVTQLALDVGPGAGAAVYQPPRGQHIERGLVC